jgi:hypothetical protein
VSKASRQLLARLDTRVRTLDTSRRRVDDLATQGTLSGRVAEQMYESLFLNAVTSFETFIEELFLSLLLSSRRSGMAVPRISVKSYKVARELVIGPGRKYADWLPFDETIKRAHVFFRGGRPFAEIPSADRDVLANALLIRNVIAHRSKHSEQRFRVQVLGQAPLPSRERTPAGFLRGQLAGSPPITRFENYAATILRIAKQLA